MRLIVTRPEPDASAQAETLAALGHEPILSPLFVVALHPIDPASLHPAQTLIVTSRNALRALEASAPLAPVLSRPLFAVGPATAEAARSLGFGHVVEGPGTAAALAALIAATRRPDQGPLIALVGERLAYDMDGSLRARGFTVRSIVAYAARAEERLSDAAARSIAAGRADGVILMSPRAAARFSELAGHAELIEKARRLRYYCLSAEVAARLTSGFAMSAEIADLPRQDRLLALLPRSQPVDIR